MFSSFFTLLLTRSLKALSFIKSYYPPSSHILSLLLCIFETLFSKIFFFYLGGFVADACPKIFDLAPVLPLFIIQKLVEVKCSLALVLPAGESAAMTDGCQIGGGKKALQSGERFYGGWFMVWGYVSLAGISGIVNLKNKFNFGIGLFICPKIPRREKGYSL